jgi:release factor glutamine methyltransferase
MSAPVTVDALLRRAGGRIEAGEARLLLAHLLGRGAAWLYAHGDAVVDAAVETGFMALVDRRAAGEPVAYLTGRRGFWTLDLAVGPATLIPRADTECLVEAALARLPQGAAVEVADLGTGSGPIALAIASERPRARVTATDRSAPALAIARANAVALGLANVAFVSGDWFAPLAGRRFALVASNPPYIAEDDPHLALGDLRHEPRSALASGADGLDDLRRIVAAAPAHLEPGGWLLLEHGHDQGPAVRGLLAEAGFDAVETIVDLEGRDRVGVGRWPGRAGTGC